MTIRQSPNGTAASLAVECSEEKSVSNLQEIVKQLYQEYHCALHRYLVATGSSPADADELVQETFLRLLRLLRRRISIERPRHWLFKVAHNLRTDSQRQLARQATFAAQELESGITATAGCDPEVQFLYSEHRERLDVALKQLTERQSTILHLRAEGLKLREISDLLGVSVQSVSEACARALERIGRLVDE